MSKYPTIHEFCEQLHQDIDFDYGTDIRRITILVAGQYMRERAGRLYDEMSELKERGDHVVFLSLQEENSDYFLVDKANVEKDIDVILAALSLYLESNVDDYRDLHALIDNLK